MRLNVGILGESQAWRMLLEQEGVPFSIVGENISANEYSVVVTGDSMDEREAESLRSYLKKGGALLCSAQIYSQLTNAHYAHFFVRHLYPEQDSPLEEAGLIDVHQKCRVAMNANTFRTEKGATSVYVGEFNDGHLVVLPFDVDRLLLEDRTMAKSFYSPARRLPYERVSVVSRGSVRKLVSRALEILHHRRSLPYMHLWYYPGNAESVFAFRVDTDRGSQEEVEQLYEIARKHRIPMTWFVDTKSQRDIIAVFQRMQHQELGIHCYEHRVFKDYERNVENINSALQVMRLANLDVKGFAAPFGKWNKGLARAVKDLEFQYSSEFSYDYDNLPSQPLVDDKSFGAWQIPVHPICVGSLKRQGYREVKMIQYFEYVLRHKLSSREPMVLYHHPKDGHHQVLEHVFNYIEGHKIPTMTFTNVLEWWKKRRSIRIQAELRGARMKFSASSIPEDVFVRISKGDGTEVITPLRHDIHLEALPWEERAKAASLPSDYLRCRRFNYRIPLTQAVDILTR